MSTSTRASLLRRWAVGVATLDARSLALLRVCVGLCVVIDVVARADTMGFYTSSGDASSIQVPGDTPHRCLLHYIWFYRGSQELQTLLFALSVARRSLPSPRSLVLHPPICPRPLTCQCAASSPAHAAGLRPPVRAPRTRHHHLTAAPRQACALSMTIGYHTRVATLLAWVGYVGVQARPALPRSWVVFESPSQTRMRLRLCVSNRQRELTLPRPTVAPTATSSARVFNIRPRVCYVQQCRCECVSDGSDRMLRNVSTRILG